MPQLPSKLKAPAVEVEVDASQNPMDLRGGTRSLLDTSIGNRKALLKSKLASCGKIFDFTNDSYPEEKEAKTAELMDILEYINKMRIFFTDELISDMISMISANIFQDLPATPQRDWNSIFDQEDEDPVTQPAWGHLQLVYELLLRTIVNTDLDLRVCKKYIDQTFVGKLIHLSDSGDNREREYLKTILHRIYGKFMGLRLFIRLSFQNLFIRVSIESDLRNGVAESLEILGSIINGFALPLKQEHIQFLLKSIIPLHKAHSYSSFSAQLIYCLVQYIEKDPRLIEKILQGIIRFWPITSATKELLFIGELEEILELSHGELGCVVRSIAKKIESCILSPHFQVAERALFLWNNDNVVKVINSHRKITFPPIISALYRNSISHWSRTVHGLTYNILKLMMEADPACFNECSANHRKITEKEDSNYTLSSEKWEKILATASLIPGYDGFTCLMD